MLTRGNTKHVLVKEGKFISFHRVELEDEVPDNFYIENKHRQIVGYINFYPQWRKYVFTAQPELPFVYDIICLREIVEFIDEVSKGQHISRKYEPKLFDY